MITYSYKDEMGKELYRKNRIEPGIQGKDKSFGFERTGDEGQVLYNLSGCRRVLYHLPDVIRGISDGNQIFLVKSEEDADELKRNGFIATTEPEPSKWSNEFTEILKEADLILLYDLDKNRLERRTMLCDVLYGQTKRLRVVDLPALEYEEHQKPDVSTWFANGHTQIELVEIISKTPDYTPEKQWVEIISNNLIEKKMKISTNIQMAERFLTQISQCDEPIFVFQVFADKKKSESPIIPKVLCGTFTQYKETLLRENEQGAGIFVTVNKTDGKGRKVENIIGIRAVFVDLDGSPLDPILSAPLSPHMIIESSPHRYHAYWIVEGIKLEQFSLIQKYLSSRFQGDTQVHDLSRVMRLPGFFHQKQETFLTKIIQESGEQPFPVQRFLDAFEIDLSPQQKSSASSHELPFVNSVLKKLDQYGMLVKKEPHPQGCWSILCPWKHLHSEQDSGTKYFEPNTNGYPGHGFKCFHKHCELKTTKDLLVHLGMDGNSPIDPLPLYRHIEAPQPFPMDALGSILGPAAIAMHRVIKAPDSVCAQSVLAAASLATQAHANIIVDGREIPLSEFYLTIAESGDRKSATDKAALRPIHTWQKMLTDCYRIEYPKFQVQKEAWENRKKEWIKNSSPGSDFNEISPQPPTRPLVLVEEPTYEGIVKYFAADGQPSIGLFSDEGGRFFGGHAMNQDNRLKTLAGLSSLWDGKEISRMRSGDGDMLLYGRRLSLHLMIQEIILSKLMGNPLFDLQGFLPRCLITYPQTMAGNRTYVEEDLTADPAIQQFNRAISQLLDSSAHGDSSTDPKNEIKARPLPLSAEAKKIWIAFHDKNDTNLAEGNSHYPIRRFASKAPEHVLRLSGTLALTEDPQVEEIAAEYIERAILLIEYYFTERLRIHGFTSINPDLVCAASLLKWFWKESHTQVGLSMVYQYGPTSLGIRNAECARTTMAVLTSHGWAIPIANASINGKKHKEAWTIVPPQNTEGC